MTQPQATDAPELGARLRELRLESGATQKEVANALGLGVSSISTYEKGTVPPEARLADYATFFAAKEAQAAGRLEVGGKLTEPDQARRKQLLDEFAALLPHQIAEAGPRSADLWTFAPGEPIMLVVGRLENMTHPYSDETNRNYTRAMMLADLDALLELHGHIRMRNPHSDVRFIRADQLTASDNRRRPEGSERRISRRALRCCDTVRHTGPGARSPR